MHALLAMRLSRLGMRATKGETRSIARWFRESDVVCIDCGGRKDIVDRFQLEQDRFRIAKALFVSVLPWLSDVDAERHAFGFTAVREPFRRKRRGE